MDNGLRLAIIGSLCGTASVIISVVLFSAIKGDLLASVCR